MKIRYFLVFIFFLSSCFSNNNLRQIHLGLGSESSEPFLLSSKDNLFLSWTEEKEDSVFLYQGKIHNDKFLFYKVEKNESRNVQEDHLVLIHDIIEKIEENLI